MNEIPIAHAEAFPSTYEAALATQDWERVAPLIHLHACVTFSDGSVHLGKAEIERAFRRNFASIKNEEYVIEDVHWVQKDERVAVYLFAFAWSGDVGGKRVHGGGRGTCVLLNDGRNWQLIVEHLGPKT